MAFKDPVNVKLRQFLFLLRRFTRRLDRPSLRAGRRTTGAAESARTGSGGEGEECRGVDAFWPSHRVAAKGPGKPLGSTRIDPPVLNQVHCPQRCFEGCVEPNPTTQRRACTRK